MIDQWQYCRWLKDYIIKEFDNLKFDTSDWEYRCSSGPTYRRNREYGYNINLAIFSETEIEDVDYTTDEDKKMMVSFVTECIEYFLANNKYSEDEEMVIDKVYFWYPKQCGKGFSISIHLFCRAIM